MKVAIYSGVSPSTTFIERLIVGLSEKGIRIFLFGKQLEYVKYNSNVINETYPNFAHQIFQIFRFYFKLGKLEKIAIKNEVKLQTSLRHKIKRLSEICAILAHKPDIFHVQWAKSINEWMFLREFGIKMVLSLRGAHINYSPIVSNDLAQMYRKCFPLIDSFHCVSYEILKEGQKYGLNISRSRVVYSGLNLKQFTKVEKIFDNKQKLNIVSIGRPHWIKGFPLLLDIFRDFKLERKNFTYSIIGGYSEEMLFQRNQLNLKKEIYFFGDFPNSKVKEEIIKADILVLPSYKEGIANVVLEAMALGKIVLASDSGGILEVITDGFNGFIFENRSRESLLTKLIFISNLSDFEYQRITLNARKTIEDDFTEEKMVSGMIDLYQNTISNS